MQKSRYSASPSLRAFSSGPGPVPLAMSDGATTRTSIRSFGTEAGGRRGGRGEECGRSACDHNDHDDYHGEAVSGSDRRLSSKKTLRFGTPTRERGEGTKGALSEFDADY